MHAGMHTVVVLSVGPVAVPRLAPNMLVRPLARAPASCALPARVWAQAKAVAGVCLEYPILLVRLPFYLSDEYRTVEDLPVRLAAMQADELDGEAGGGG